MVNGKSYTMKNKLTIIIPCKNEGMNLVNTIKSLNFKNIIIADSSDDDTIELLWKHINFPIKVVKGGFPSVARNNGFKEVKTPYVLFIDSDMIIKDKNLIQYCLREMENKDLDLVTVRITTEDYYRYCFLVFDFVQLILSKITPFSVGGFMIFKSDTFKELGGFGEDEKFAEDYSLSKNIKPNKFKIINKKIYTSSRRFRKKGLFYIIKMMILSFINRNNPEFFKKDWNYWN
jgi:glycosyltransferase involved in cell wall biosynthesis